MSIGEGSFASLKTDALEFQSGKYSEYFKFSEQEMIPSSESNQGDLITLAPFFMGHSVPLLFNTFNYHIRTMKTAEKMSYRN